MQAEFVVCGQLPESTSSSAGPHVNGHACPRTPLSRRALCKAKFTRAHRVQAHRTDTERTLQAEFVVCGNFLTARLPQARTHFNGRPSVRALLGKRELCAADFTLALSVQAHRTDTESTLPAEFLACEHFSDSQASSARPHVNGHPSPRTPLSKRVLCTADFTRAHRVQAHDTDAESTLQDEFFVCRQFPDNTASSARPHVNGHASEDTSLSKIALCTADFTRALRVQAHRTDMGSTLQAEFVVCGQFPDSQLSEQGLTLLATKARARHSAKERSAQQTSLGRLECRPTGLTPKAHCKLNSLYASIFLTARLPQQGLTLMATQALARCPASRALDSRLHSGA